MLPHLHFHPHQAAIPKSVVQDVSYLMVTSPRFPESIQVTTDQKTFASYLVEQFGPKYLTLLGNLLEHVILFLRRSCKPDRYPSHTSAFFAFLHFVMTIWFTANQKKKNLNATIFIYWTY